MISQVYFWMLQRRCVYKYLFQSNDFCLGWLPDPCSEKLWSTVEMLHVNSFNTLHIFLTMSMLLGEPADIGQSVSIDEPEFTWVFGLLILSGCILTYAQFLCAAVCSALTTSMISVAKSVIQTVLGFFTFGGVQVKPFNITCMSCLNVI